MTVNIDANPRQQHRGRALMRPTEEILRFYASLVGDAPYASATIALVESALPGGHSPAYFSMLNEPQESANLSWRGDPAMFEGFPDFFLAHELAHQWWGQAVGWKNYHEQWLSEGFSQYFAALYAQKTRGDRVFADMLRQFRRWSLVGIRPGAGLSRLPPRTHQVGPARLPRARLQQGRGGAAHAPPAARRRGRSSRACATSTRIAGTRRRAPTTSSARWRPHRVASSIGSSSGGFTAPRFRA